MRMSKKGTPHRDNVSTTLHRNYDFLITNWSRYLQVCLQVLNK